MYVTSIYGKTRYIRYIIHLSKKQTIPDITNYNNIYITHVLQTKSSWYYGRDTQCFLVVRFTN